MLFCCCCCSFCYATLRRKCTAIERWPTVLVQWCGFARLEATVSVRLRPLLAAAAAAETAATTPHSSLHKIATWMGQEMHTNICMYAHQQRTIHKTQNWFCNELLADCGNSRWQSVVRLIHIHMHTLATARFSHTHTRITNTYNAFYVHTLCARVSRVYIHSCNVHSCRFSITLSFTLPCIIE